MSSDIEQLVEMGFPRSLAEKALISTKHQGISEAMEWLIEHQGDTENVQEENKDEVKNTDGATALSFKCEDCNKLLRNEDEVQLHLARTGHVNFAESTEEVKPLTEEERKARAEKLQELLRQKRMQLDESEKQAEIEREKRRREQGKTLTSAKAKFEEDEKRRIVEERIREKSEDKAYRERLKAEIARDRQLRKQRQEGYSTGISNAPTTDSAPTAGTSDASALLQSPIGDECQLQIRMPTGQPIKARFNSSDPFSSVIKLISDYLRVEADAVSVMTNFPKRTFSAEDFSTSLADLNLCPSSVLIVRKLMDQPA